MNAIRFDHRGEPVKILAIEERLVPDSCGWAGRVRILATPVNPSDLRYVRGHYAGVQKAQLPGPVGFEGVGIVDAPGPQVQAYVPGHRVAVLNSRRGNWAEYAVVLAGESFLLPVPEEIKNEQVASFVINRPQLSYGPVRHVLAVPRGEWLLQSAAGSELGRMIVKLARHDGIRTVNVVCRSESIAGLERLGARPHRKMSGVSTSTIDQERVHHSTDFYQLLPRHEREVIRPVCWIRPWPD